MDQHLGSRDVSTPFDMTKHGLLTTDSAANCQRRHPNRGADNFPAS
jgi:hypothetical protein